MHFKLLPPFMRCGIFCRMVLNSLAQVLHIKKSKNFSLQCAISVKWLMDERCKIKFLCIYLHSLKCCCNIFTSFLVQLQASILQMTRQCLILQHLTCEYLEGERCLITLLSISLSRWVLLSFNDTWMSVAKLGINEWSCYLGNIFDDGEKCVRCVVGHGSRARPWWGYRGQTPRSSRDFAISEVSKWLMNHTTLHE